MGDIKRLKAEADIERVIEDLGIEVFDKGATKFIRCPIPGHDDKHPTNCYFKPGWRNVLCKACGKSVEAIDLIMYETGCDFGEAADRLWEIEGRPVWYNEDRKNHKKGGFELSGKEKRLIELKFGINTKDFVTEAELKNIAYKKAQAKLHEYDIIELAMREEKLFEEEREVLKEIIKKCNQGA